jgi:glycosyltransferase involved in cell wall biosynthesis
MYKVCIVVQRYGIEVNGGAELLAREIAEHLTKFCKVTVYTTKAIDYMSWENAYKSDTEIINGVMIYRFSVEHCRNQNRFNSINAKFLNGSLPVEMEDQWFEDQGPFVPDLIEALENNINDYDVFIFNTYLYYPTVYGIPVVKEKSLLIPDAHDEPFLKFNRVREEFNLAAAIFYNTEAERKLVLEHFHNTHIPYQIGGAGVDIIKHPSPSYFKVKFHITSPYIIYVGRIDEGKGCDIMFQYWAEYKKRNPSNLKLVLLGKEVISVPSREDIISLGFVSDEDKFSGIEGSEFLLLPSRYESLSIVVLEAMSLKVPVLVNGTSEVLRNHCHTSNAGLYYNEFYEFESAVKFLLSDRPEVMAMRNNGPIYIRDNYQWDAIIIKLMELIKTIKERQIKEI